MLLAAAVAAASGACRAADSSGPVPPETAPLPAEVVLRDVNGDGVEDTLTVYAVDPATGEQRTEADTNGDGRPDFWATVDPASEAAKEIAYDTTGDGRADVWERYQALRLVETRRDTNADGEADEWTLYDQAGYAHERRQDGDFDGRADVWSIFRAGGKSLERVAYDTDGDGEPDRWLNYAEDGSLASVQRDTDGDGIPDAIAVPERR